MVGALRSAVMTKRSREEDEEDWVREVKRLGLSSNVVAVAPGNSSANGPSGTNASPVSSQESRELSGWEDLADYLEANRRLKALYLERMSRLGTSCIEDGK
ncbi:hypothetical protein NDN08_008147 [Rhodosorus marinus]|uniref:Uncharacterized protein n=1 Tax=Rhodosorus marinus TaxID=101924 RepID=A0AAV8V0P9_9RHOD|nr:hypothetical protein NDN08_008147 [Rhodosorus marinus]